MIYYFLTGAITSNSLQNFEYLNNFISKLTNLNRSKFETFSQILKDEFKILGYLVCG